MTEREYIIATNLTKLRVASRAIADTLLANSGQHEVEMVASRTAISSLLDRLIELHEQEVDRVTT